MPHNRISAMVTLQTSKCSCCQTFVRDPRLSHVMCCEGWLKTKTTAKNKKNPFVLFACFCDAELVNVATAQQMIV